MDFKFRIWKKIGSAKLQFFIGFGLAALSQQIRGFDDFLRDGYFEVGELVGALVFDLGKLLLQVFDPGGSLYDDGGLIER